MNYFTIGIVSVFKEFLVWMKAVQKGLSWFVLTLFFGMFQVWLTLLLHIFVTSPFDSLFHKFILDGAILFFSIAVVSSLTIDYYIFSKGIFPWDWFNIFMFIVAPIIIVFFGSILFAVCYLTPTEKINFRLVFYADSIIFIATLLHTVAVKATTFKKSC